MWFILSCLIMKYKQNEIQLVTFVKLDVQIDAFKKDGHPKCSDYTSTFRFRLIIYYFDIFHPFKFIGKSKISISSQ